MITDIFFDFDGTLVDSREAIVYGFSKAAKYCLGVENYIIPTHLIGKGFYDIFAHEFKDMSQEQKIEFIKTYREIYDNETYSFHLIYPNVENVLFSLKETRKLHVLSLKEERVLQGICQKLNLTDYFNNIFGPTHDHEEKIDTFRKKINLMNLKPEQCLMIGDSHSDYKAATGLGIKFVYASYGYGVLDDFSGISINNFQEIINHL